MIENQQSFGEMSQSFDDLQKSLGAKEVSVAISGLSKQLIQIFDSQFRLQQMQKILTNLIVSGFEGLTKEIQLIKNKIGLQTATNNVILNNVDQNINIKNYSMDALDSLDIHQHSQLTQISQFQHQDQEEDQPIYQSSQFVAHQQKKHSPENRYFDPSFLLEYLGSTFRQMNLKFSKCEKLYQFPQLKDINFHIKIDKIDNILFLAQLQNNQMIGGFTNRCFDPAPNYIPKQNPKSFIGNLTQNTYAYANRINKTHTHDPNYLIFGNWQIKVRAGEDVLQTNWGTNGDCFSIKYGIKDGPKIKPNDFFGPGAQTKKLKMKKYNFYAFR